MAVKGKLSVERMKENFIKHHEEGKEIKEIAKMYEISLITVYNNLQEIADNAHVTRESLLVSPRSHYERSKMAERIEKEKISPKQLLDDFTEAIEATDRIVQKIDKYLQGGK